MCVVCRERTEPESLVRLVKDPDGNLVVDLRGKLPGRGAWVHPHNECVTKLSRKPGMLKRAMRGVPTGMADLRPRIEEALRRAIGDGFSLAAAAGALIGGAERLGQAIQKGQVVWVAVASDAADRTIDTLKRGAPEQVRFVKVPFTRAELGGVTGRGPRAALGVSSSRAATHLRLQLRRLRSLG